MFFQAYFSNANIPQGESEPNRSFLNLNKIADREDKRKEFQGTKKITIQQLNVLLRQSDEKLKSIEGDAKGKKG